MPLFEFPWIYRGFSSVTAQKAFHSKHFRRIQSHPKQPSKIAKQPLTHKTRNQFARKRTRVRIPSSPPLKALGIRCLFSFFGFIQRAKEEPQAHLETIPLLFIALMPACTPQVVFAVALSLFSARHPAWQGTRSDFAC